MSERDAILVVEDDDALRFIACKLFAKLGAIAHAASSAAEALALIDRHGDDIGLVFSDMRMPGYDGVELARHILREHPSIAVALTSGDTITHPPLDGVIVVQKPWRLDELRQLVSQFVRPAISRSQ